MSSLIEREYGWTLVLIVSCPRPRLTIISLVHASRIGRMMTCLVLLVSGTMID